MHSLLNAICEDVGLTTTDTQYLLNRFRSEGFSFITCTLPLLSKWILASIECGEPLPLRDFTTSFRIRGRFPIFMRSLFINAMNGDCVDLYRIRQICEYMYKLAIPSKGVSKAVDSFIKCNRICKPRVPSSKKIKLLRRMSLINETIFSTSNLTLEDLLTRPSDGPGAFLLSTNSRIVEELPIQKPKWLRMVCGSLYEKVCSGLIKQDLPYLPVMYALISCEMVEHVVWNRNVSNERVPMEVFKKQPYSVRGSHPTSVNGHSKYLRPSGITSHLPYFDVIEPSVAQLLCVPKDSRGPRLISKEPLNKVRVAQSVRKALFERFSQGSKGHIHFDDQTVNQNLARKGSIDQSIDTLDQKDASNLISRYDVAYILRDTPLLSVIESLIPDYVLPFTKELCGPGLNQDIEYIVKQLALAEKSGKYPDFLEDYRLHMFGMMGNPLTFAILSWWSYLVSISACTLFGVPLSFAMENVDVVGDDICCHSSLTSFIKWGLKHIGSKVNNSKSYIKSRFRESCGGDYLAGNDVTPCRLKLSSCDLSVRNGQVIFGADSATVINQLSQHAKELHKKQLYAAQEAVHCFIESHFKDFLSGVLVKGKLPVFDVESPLIGRYVSNFDVTTLRRARALLPVSRRVDSNTCDVLRYEDWLISSQERKFNPFGIGTAHINGDCSVDLRHSVVLKVTRVSKQKAVNYGL